MGIIWEKKLESYGKSGMSFMEKIKIQINKDYFQSLEVVQNIDKKEKQDDDNELRFF